MTLRFSLLLAVLLLAACDSADVPIPDPVPVDPVVEGVNLDTLLAAPTAAERSAVLTELGQRAEAVRPADFAVVTTSGGGGASVQVVSFTSPFPSGVGRLYGAIRVPDLPPGSHERLPVLVVVPEGEGDVSTASFLTDGPYAELGEAFIQMLLAPPGASLRAGSTTYDSEPLPEAFASLYDYEVDLARALLKAALGAHATVADPERIGFAGFGRGGTVALLLAARPDSPTYPFDPVAVAAIAPFTDYAAPSFRNVVSRLLRDQSPSFPGSDELAARYIHPLRERDLPMEDVREALLRRSPLYFAGALPAVFLRHGTDDIVIGSDHSARLADQLAGRINIELFPEVGHETLLADPNVQRALATYLLETVAGDD